MSDIRLNKHSKTIKVFNRKQNIRLQHTGKTGPKGEDANTPDATSTVKGKLKLAGDLGGTADLPTVPGLANKADVSALTSHTSNTNNPHNVTKDQVGLGNVDNTSDADKPISNAVQTELDSLDDRVDDIEGYIDLPVDTTDLDSVMTTLLSHIPSTLGTGTSQNYRSPTTSESAGIVVGMRLIAREMGKKYSEIDISDAVTFLGNYGFTVTKGYDLEGLFPFVLVQAEYTYPSSSDYRAWGNYFFNMSAPLSTVIEAPHPQTDGNSENIALNVWREIPGAIYVMSSVNRKARDYMITEVSTDHTSGTYTLDFRGQVTAPIAYNASIATVQTAIENLSTVGVGNVTVTGDPANTSLHTFINLSGDLYNSGSPTDTITISTNSLSGGSFLTLDHDADAAHNYNSPFSQVVSAIATQGYSQLQLHGFSDTSSGIPRVFSAILSKGSSNDTKLTEVVKSALEAQGLDVAVRDSYDTQGIYFTGSPTGGTFTLTCDGQTTSAITYSTNAATLASNITTALLALSSIQSGNIVTTVSQNNNGSIPAFVITFKGDMYHAGKQITLANNSLTGGVSPTPVMLTANGTALTAESNTQGDIAEQNGTVFQHLELSATVRNSSTLSAKVVSALAKLNLPQLSAAAMPVLAESGHTSSQSPLTNGSGATIGVSPVAARADHRHPMTNNTPVEGDYVRRGSASWVAVSSNQIRTDLSLPTSVADDSLVMHLANAETATGIKTFQTDTSGNGVQILRSSSTTGQESKLGLRVSATPNNTSNMAEISALRTDSPSSQDTALVFKTRRSGSAVSEVARFDTGGNLQMNNGKVINVTDPSSDQDAATKKYVDDGLAVKQNIDTEPFLPRWQAALAQSHTNQISAVIVGSSTTAGSNAQPGTRYVDQLGHMLHKQFNLGASTGGYHIRTADGSWTTGGTVTTIGEDLSDYARSLAAGASLTRTFTDCTGFDIYFAQGPAQGQFTVTIDGTLVATVTPDTTGSVRYDGVWTSSLLTRGSHTLVITAVAACIIGSVYVQDSDSATGVRLYNSGLSGATTSTFSTNTTMWQRAAALPNTSLVVIMLNSNDYANSVAPATYKANVLSIINNAKAALTTQRPDFLIVNAFKRLDVTPTYDFDDYSAAGQELADEEDQVYYVDTAQYFPTVNDATNDPQNLIDTDNIHPTVAGHSYYARLINNAIAPDLGKDQYDVTQSQIVLRHADGTDLPILPVYTTGTERGIRMGGLQLTSGRFDITSVDNKVEFRATGTNPQFNIYSLTHGQNMFQVNMTAGAVTGTNLYGDVALANNRNFTMGTNGSIYVNNVTGTNFERTRIYYASNVFTIINEAGGTGTVRNIALRTPNRRFEIADLGTSSGVYQMTIGSGQVNAAGLVMTGSYTASSGTSVALNVAPTIAGSSTQGYTAIQANVTETSTGSGTKRLLDLQVGGVSKVSVRNDGVFMPVQAPTASAPAYVLGGMYFDTTLNKLRIGGASGWETVTSS
jgi:lysophospholipase L1-like esterase